MSRTPPTAAVLLGCRRVGKTTLLNEITRNGVVRQYNGDTPADIERLDMRSAEDVAAVLSGVDTIVIDEAQRFPDIRLTLKRLVDANERLQKQVHIFAAASTSLYLAKGVRESAVGRLVCRHLWPLSITELAAHVGWSKVLQDIDRRIVYGLYPDVHAAPESASSTLLNYTESVLFKDLFALSDIRQKLKFEKLVRTLACRIGSVVSYEGLARDTGLSSTTVMRYISLLEQCFIVKVCNPFSRNFLNELETDKKIYFCDTGVRNAIINDFSAMGSREDAGALWENFFFMERIKLHSNQSDFKRMFFWRTAGNTPQEIDFVEVVDNKMEAFECKLSAWDRAKSAAGFAKAYPNCPVRTASPANLMNIWTDPPL
ncbi:MAG: ATP-binding protein [Oscillospiraceae bacterium]|nr:ATP-binding protein [Oscillospiraceae bacterium]